MKFLDYSFARPDPATIKSSGFDAVIRYLSPNAGKNLTASERDKLRSAGLGIGLVWEWYADRASEGREAGIQDAQAALAQANALGFPNNLPIFFAIDWDIADYAPASTDPRAKLGIIDDYFDGVISVLGADRVGAYGGYWAIKRLFDAGLIKYGWQTYAWSGGQWDSRAQLRQVLNGQWNGSVDFNDTTTDNAGFWTTGDPVTPAPAPTPLPAPAGGVHPYNMVSGDTFWGLEAKNGWTHGTLSNLNPQWRGKESKIPVGTTIQVPGAGAAPAAANTGYVIRDGDTFWGLEAANSWSHGTLQGLNPGVDPTKLRIGQSINIPGKGAAPAQHTYGHHTIVSGDTYWSVAHNGGWAVATLEQLNPQWDVAHLPIGGDMLTP